MSSLPDTFISLSLSLDDDDDDDDDAKPTNKTLVELTERKTRISLTEDTSDSISRSHRQDNRRLGPIIAARSFLHTCCS